VAHLWALLQAAARSCACALTPRLVVPVGSVMPAPGLTRPPGTWPCGRKRHMWPCRPRGIGQRRRRWTPSPPCGPAWRARYRTACVVLISAGVAIAAWRALSCSRRSMPPRCLAYAWSIGARAGPGVPKGGRQAPLRGLYPIWVHIIPQPMQKRMNQQSQLWWGLPRHGRTWRLPTWPMRTREVAFDTFPVDGW